jgi:hypothetical protein
LIPSTGNGFSLSKLYRLIATSTQSSLQCVPLALFWGINRQKPEADYSLLCSADVKDGKVYPRTGHAGPEGE